MVVEWINAAGGRAHERTIGTFPPRGEPRKDNSGRHDTTVHVVTPDLVSTNPQGGTTAYDVVVVGVAHKDGFKGAAAATGCCQQATRRQQQYLTRHGCIAFRPPSNGGRLTLCMESPKATKLP